MNNETVEAMSKLYGMYEKQKQQMYYQEVIDRALDEFVRNPERIKDPYKMCVSALGSSKKVVKSRSNKQAYVYDSENYENIFQGEDLSLNEYLDDVVNIDTINKVVKNERYAHIIKMLYYGAKADDIMIEYNISNKHANTLISRARLYAKNRFEKEHLYDKN